MNKLPSNSEDAKTVGGAIQTRADQSSKPTDTSRSLLEDHSENDLGEMLYREDMKVTRMLTGINAITYCSNMVNLPLKLPKKVKANYFLILIKDANEIPKLPVILTMDMYLNDFKNKPLVVRCFPIRDEKYVFTNEILQVILSTLDRRDKMNQETLDKLNKFGNEHTYTPRELCSSIPLGQFKTMLKEYGVDESLIIIVPDIIHHLKSTGAFQTALCSVSTLNYAGESVMSPEQAMFFTFQSVVCGVKWRLFRDLKSLEPTKMRYFALMEYYAKLCLGVMITEKFVITKIEELKRDIFKNCGLKKKDMELKGYMHEDMQWTDSFPVEQAIETCAKFGIPNGFENFKCTHVFVWSARWRYLFEILRDFYGRSLSMHKLNIVNGMSLKFQKEEQGSWKEKHFRLAAPEYYKDKSDVEDEACNEDTTPDAHLEERSEPEPALPSASLPPVMGAGAASQKSLETKPKAKAEARPSQSSSSPARASPQPKPKDKPEPQAAKPQDPSNESKLCEKCTRTGQALTEARKAMGKAKTEASKFETQAGKADKFEKDLKEMRKKMKKMEEEMKNMKVEKEKSDEEKEQMKEANDKLNLEVKELKTTVETQKQQHIEEQQEKAMLRQQLDQTQLAYVNKISVLDIELEKKNQIIERIRASRGSNAKDPVVVVRPHEASTSGTSTERILDELIKKNTDFEADKTMGEIKGMIKDLILRTADSNVKKYAKFELNQYEGTEEQYRRALQLNIERLTMASDPSNLLPLPPTPKISLKLIEMIKVQNDIDDNSCVICMDKLLEGQEFEQCGTCCKKFCLKCADGWRKAKQQLGGGPPNCGHCRKEEPSAKV